MDIEKIIHILKKHSPLVTYGKDHSHSKIYHHWEIILITFLILNILMFGFSLYLFLKINEGGIFLIEQKQEMHINTIDREGLQQLIISFDVKDVLFKDRTDSIPRLPDPSL